MKTKSYTHIYTYACVRVFFILNFKRKNNRIKKKKTPGGEKRLQILNKKVNTPYILI